MRNVGIPLRSLITRLALFYAALSLLALLLVKTTVLLLEFHDLQSALERGALADATANAAQDFGRNWTGEQAPSPEALKDALEVLLLRLQRPRAQLGGEPSYILSELAAQPLAAALLGADGGVLAAAPADGDWQADPAREFSGALDKVHNATSAQLLAASDAPDLLRRFAAAVRDRNGALRGVLVLELRLQPPWRQPTLGWNVEWPILVAYLLVFALGSALFLSRYVTRRLQRITAAADSWGRGDFSSSIDDRAADEIGRLARELNRMAGDLRALVATRARLATLEERQRLARELHDTIKQKAFALNLQLAVAVRELSETAQAPRARLHEARRITEEIQHELAQILDELRAPDVSATLQQEIETRVQDWSRRSGIGSRLQAPAAAGVPDTQRQAIVRILDEALANVLRHSGATVVRVDLTRDNGEFVLRIVDDGRGTAEDRGAGMGLANMRDRAAALPAGRFALDSVVGSGTTITVCWQAQPTQ